MDDYIAYLQEVFADFGEVSARRMFGGYGLYRDGLMFALVADEVLYLKVDDGNRPRFEAEALGPFLYDKGGRTVAMSYYRAPEAIMDDSELAADWARSSWEAAARARSAKAR